MPQALKRTPIRLLIPILPAAALIVNVPPTSRPGARDCQAGWAQPTGDAVPEAMQGRCGAEVAGLAGGVRRGVDERLNLPSDAQGAVSF